MLGAIIGDIVGSRFEFNNTKDFNFKLFTDECDFTDDTICTVAIADAYQQNLVSLWGLVLNLKAWCRKYPYPMGGYGGSFARWINSDKYMPYNSFGNGSAMRVSSMGWLFDTEQRVIVEATKSAVVTHNHPEGVKGAVATALAIFYAREYSKEIMLTKITDYYPAYTWIDPKVGCNKFDETCQGTMPVVFGILRKANSFEEAIRWAVAVGGDSDTIAAIVGSIAEAIWGIPIEMKTQAMNYLPTEMIKVIDGFYDKING